MSNKSENNVKYHKTKKKGYCHVKISFMLII